MPTAQADATETSFEVSVTIDVLANDAGPGLAIIGYTEPGAGTLVLSPDRSFNYTPGAGFIGTDGFTYTVRDAGGETATATVEITVSRPNRAPVATDDAARTAAGAGVVVPVLGNDSDPDEDSLTLVGIEAPGHGTVQVEPSGDRVRYTPQAGFVGTDSFAYTVGDGRGGIATANVTVTVSATSGEPVAAPDHAVTLEGTPVTIDVLANDDDPEGEPLTFTDVTLPAYGTLSLTPEQRFLYTPEPGFVGADSFTYTVRDGAGLGATGTVTIVVESRNAPPTAAADMAATTSGTPVNLALLANDNDPDGDSLRLTALSLPAHGRIAVNPDQTVTYTPDPGFSGTDRLSYRVSDGTAEAEAEAVIEVSLPEGLAFPNGYRYRRRLVVPPPSAGGETVQDVVLLVQETRDWLRSVAAGGRVESAQGFDLRFEAGDGTRLDHELERYEPTNGELVAWVRVPSWRLADPLELLLYYGKPGLAAGEANPAGTWRGYLAVWNTLTGTDRTGKGRGLQPSNIATGSLIAGCGRFDGAAVAQRADAAFLNGHAGLTVQAMIQAEAAMAGSDHGVLAQGPMTGDETQAGLSLGYLARSPEDTERVVAFRLRCADGETLACSGPDAHATGRQLLHGTWRQGRAPSLYLDGAPVTAAGGGPARSGLTAMPGGGLYLGAGGRDSASGGWRGLIDEVRVRASELPAAWIALEHANLAQPQACYGLGGEDVAGDAATAPVALPLAARIAVGTHVDLDPLAVAWGPAGGGTALAAVETPADGKATIVDGRLRYTPRAGFVGTDSFAYTLIGGGAKTSTALVTVTVAAAPLQAVDDTVSTSADQAAVIDVLANDTGTSLAILGAGAPAHGTTSLNGNGSITYRPAADFTGTDSFTYRVGNGSGESSARVLVTVTDGAADLPYAYVHKPASAILPTSDSDIVVWTIPAAGGTCPHVGNPDQVLLMVAPNGPIRGAVSATNLQFKAVFLIGATLRPQGITSLLTPNGTWVRGGDALRISFAATIPVRPVLFLANIDYDARNGTEDNVFGDFLQAGTARPAAAAGDPDGSANRERWADLYLQKIRVAHGSYSFSAGEGASVVSAFFRPRVGGVGDVHLGQVDLRWHGPAVLLQGYPAPRDTLRPNARLLMNRVALRALPATAATGETLAAPTLLHLTGEAATVEAMVTQLERGNYQAAFFNEVHLQRYAETDDGSFAPYVTPSQIPGGATLRYDSVARKLGFPAYKAPGRLHPVWTGEIAVGDAAPVMVSDGEVGAGLRVASATKLRELLMPRLDLRAMDDQATASRGKPVEIDLLANDVGPEGATVTLGTPAQGTVTLTPERKARYTPAEGYVGPDSFAYTLERGSRSSSAAVSVSVSAQTVGAWGAGPRSGDRWWTGFGDVTGNNLGIVDSFERLRNRPVDLVALWAPRLQISSWDDMAGGPGDNEAVIGGTLSKGVNNRKVIWDNPSTRSLPVHLNLTLVPPPFSNRNGANPGIWWDYAAGQFDVYWRRLGRRMAHLDDITNRTAPLILDLGWEHSGPWYPWSITGARAGTPAYTQFPTAFARIVAAIREGHRAYAGQDCPYLFCWRPARVAVAAGIRHAAFYPGDEVVDLIGISHHERDPYLTPSNWASRTSGWPPGNKFTREGWDPFFDFCASRGKKACFPEWSPIQHHPVYEPSGYPEEFFRLTRSYIESRLELFAYDCYFNGDEAKLTAKPAWAGTGEYKKLWGRR